MFGLFGEDALEKVLQLIVEVDHARLPRLLWLLADDNFVLDGVDQAHQLFLLQRAHLLVQEELGLVLRNQVDQRFSERDLEDD